MHNPRAFEFIAGNTGAWSILSIKPVIGATLPVAERLDVTASTAIVRNCAAWVLRGVTSNVRYVTRPERGLLLARQVDPGRAEAIRAALIPIKKTAAWWDLPQDERRKIFEESSRHTQTGMKYLPQIARRLHHCRDLGTSEPFDFLTWFDYAPNDADGFEELVGKLRRTEEWNFVEREVDVRLAR
jgi:hypothetical protein